MVRPFRKSLNKNAPIWSHEFIIQNHADIISCIVMVFVIGLVFQTTSPVSSIFVALQHNITNTDYMLLYETGASDCAAVIFYSLICIIVHAILQEHVLDKISKKLHLSKSKLAVFNRSGQLTVFYVISTFWGLDVIVLREHYLPHINLIWTDYPAPMPYLMKLYLIIQLAYCLHQLPELYFQRTKKEDYLSKMINIIIALILIAIPYFLNFHRLLICLLVLHHISELIHHVGEIVQTIDKDEKFVKGIRLVSCIILVVARLGSIVLAVVTLWYGLALGTQLQLDIRNGYFNTPTIRLTVLTGILILQLYHIYNFISLEVAHARENMCLNIASCAKPQKKDKFKKFKRSNTEESDLPEVDQNTNKNLKYRNQKTK